LIEIELAVKCAQSIGKNKKKVTDLPSTIFLLTFFVTDMAILITKVQLFWCLQIDQKTNEIFVVISALASKGQLISKGLFASFT
jgi:hypothetical protein